MLSEGEFFMPELVSRTVRIRRGWLDRLRGFERLYETKVTDGQSVTYGRGGTRESSEQAALRKWDAQFAYADEVTDYDLQVEVQGEDLLITLPGCGFRAVYYKPTGQQQLRLRQRTECDDNELLLQAWEAANLKARELGWIGRRFHG
jgi:hypothetical protein